jgi:hypothetical protein
LKFESNCAGHNAKYHNYAFSKCSQGKGLKWRSRAAPCRTQETGTDVLLKIVTILHRFPDFTATRNQVEANDNALHPHLKHSHHLLRQESSNSKCSSFAIHLFTKQTLRVSAALIVTFHLQAAQQGLTCQRVMHVSSLRSSIAILMVAVVFAITYRYLHLGRFEELGLRLQDSPAFWPDPQVHFYASHVVAPQNTMKPPFPLTNAHPHHHPIPHLHFTHNLLYPG